MEKCLNDFKLISPQLGHSSKQADTKEIEVELNIPISNDNIAFIHLLNNNQKLHTAKS